jgi:general secretion pathway protein D
MNLTTSLPNDASHCRVFTSIFVAALLVLPGASASAQTVELAARQPASAPLLARSSGGDLQEPAVALKTADADSLITFMQLGSGLLVNPPKPVVATGEVVSPVSLSFENGDLREVVKNIIGDLLGENYILHPSVQGVVSLRTAKPIAKNEVIGLLETLLKASNFALVKDGNYWRILPAADSVRGLAKPLVSLPGAQSGAVVVVYPVRYLGAKELQRVLEPFARDAASSLRVDELRNFLFISGSSPEVARLSEIADMFDVSLLKGMSFALVTLKNADVKSVMADYERIVGGAAANPFAGLLRVVPIERMNAILIISARSEMIIEARQWLERLDFGGDTGNGQKLFVYELRFAQAEKLQPILQSVIGGRSLSGSTATVAPGQTAVNIAAPANPIPGQSIVQPGNTPGTTQARPQTQGAAQNAATGNQRNAPTITADKDRNSLLVLATQAEYNAIESVIRRLDTPPKQVAIDVQIAEVSLTGDFKFGLSTYFQGKLDSAGNRLTSANGLGQLTSAGFTYTWKKTDLIKALLDLSQDKGQVRTLSQPTLITLENQKATFTSGKQISVRTQTQAAGSTVGSTAVDSFQYINTGITINVTPRVSGDNVFLEIQHEKSDSIPKESGNPDITRNTTSTSVMVQSGDTMLLGGLFQDDGSNGSSGLPLLSTIPGIGGLFGSQTWRSNRSELVLLITPRILQGIEDTRGVVDELRRRMEGIENYLPKASVAQRPTAAPPLLLSNPTDRPTQSHTLPVRP